MLIERGFSKEIEKDSINSFAWERVRQYQHLKVANFEIRTPFFSNDFALNFGRVMHDVGLSNEDIVRVFDVYNNNGMPFGWFRGKGTPEQLEYAAAEIAKLWGLDLRRATSPEVIVEFMKAAGLGVDCSGFVYQTLEYAFDRSGNYGLLEDTLEWTGSIRQRDAYNASIVNFTGNASWVIEPLQVEPLDIIVLKDSTRKKYSHMALILEDSSSLVISQSVIGQVPTGIHISYLQIVNSSPRFGFRPNLTESWEDLYRDERLEFRRLKVFSA